jgi:hypothetical protein
VALVAAVFRILGEIRGPDLLNVPTGNVLPILFLIESAFVDIGEVFLVFYGKS